jgi:8-oxo-dGTP diphosphatase
MDAQDRLACSNCGWIYYPQLKVGAGVLIEQEGRLLLIRRTTPPFKGTWNLPAGFAEPNESPIETARREALEEVGLTVEVGDLHGAFYFNDDPRGSGILLVYSGKSNNQEPSPSSEGVDPTFFSRDEIPSELSGGGHDQAIGLWMKQPPV